MGYLFAAYAIIWIVLFGYIYFLSQRISAVRRELEALKETLSSRER